MVAGISKFTVVDLNVATASLRSWTVTAFPAGDEAQIGAGTIMGFFEPASDIQGAIIARGELLGTLTRQRREWPSRLDRGVASPWSLN